MNKKLSQEWAKNATVALAGKKVSHVQYHHMEDTDRGAPAIVFTDGTYLVALSDDEGNDAGALHTNLPGDLSILPTIR